MLYLKNLYFRFKVSGKANPAKIINNSRTKKYGNKQNKDHFIMHFSLFAYSVLNTRGLKLDAGTKFVWTIN